MPTTRTASADDVKRISKTLRTVPQSIGITTAEIVEYDNLLAEIESFCKMKRETYRQQLAKRGYVGGTK